MSAQPQNCFICHNPWGGPDAICDTCKWQLRSTITSPPLPPPKCSYCNGKHDDADCLSAALAAQRNQAIHQANQRAQMRNPYRHSRASSAFRAVLQGTHTTHRYAPPLKVCPACRGNYLIESKAGSVCSSCKTVVHNPCPECTSTHTRGISDGGQQFIECRDCLFIE